MDDDEVRGRTVTERVKGWLRVSRFLSASMVVYLRFNCRFRGAPVKLGVSWVEVPPVELGDSRPKSVVRDEAARPNHKRDNVGTARLKRK